MENALYRKYRSKNFAEIIGQDNIKTLLINSIKNNKLSHAYLFCGPRGTGKTSLARLMAKAVNCEKFNEVDDVCNNCSSCLQINSQNALDIIEMDAASNRGIEEIRALKEEINYLPTSLKYKVYIIDEIHMLTKEAFNALLKTLEEPPSHVLILLATTEPHKVPVTILSRVQRYDLSLANENQVADKLRMILKNENIEFEDDAIRYIYNFTGGSFRDAESLLGKLVSEGNLLSGDFVKKSLGIISKDTMSSFLDALVGRNIHDSISLAERITLESPSIASFTDQFLSFLKDILTEKLINGDTSDLKAIQQIISKFIELKSNLKLFDNSEMLLKFIVVQIVGENAVSENYDVKASSTKIEKKVIEDKPIKEIKKENLEPTPPDNLSTTLIDLSEEYSPRLKSLLESSKVLLEDGCLVIQNKYQFNVKYLDTQDVKNFLLASLKSLEIKVNSVRVIKADETDAERENEGNNSKGSSFVEELISTEPKEKESTEKEEKDNSDLVESILL